MGVLQRHFLLRKEAGWAGWSPSPHARAASSSGDTIPCPQSATHLGPSSPLSGTHRPSPGTPPSSWWVTAQPRPLRDHTLHRTAPAPASPLPAGLGPTSCEHHPLRSPPQSVPRWVGGCSQGRGGRIATQHPALARGASWSLWDRRPLSDDPPPVCCCPHSPGGQAQMPQGLLPVEGAGLRQVSSAVKFKVMCRCLGGNRTSEPHEPPLRHPDAQDLGLWHQLEVTVPAPGSLFPSSLPRDLSLATSRSPAPTGLPGPSHPPGPAACWASWAPAAGAIWGPECSMGQSALSPARLAWGVPQGTSSV